MKDKSLKEFLDGTVACVEANDFERHMLWERYAKTSKFIDWPTKVEWVQNYSGLGREIGLLDGRPVFVSLLNAVIEGRKILFYHCTSVVCDWKMIEDWLKGNLPQTAIRKDGYVNKTDANNFHNALRD